ncbi:MAG: methionine gamma-lyase family protein, partial [Candidatus Coproplasma sp.]
MIDKEIFIKECEDKLKEKFALADEISYHNQKKVMQAFSNNGIAIRHFAGTTGYGYGDEGRDTLGKLYAEVFNTESGIVSPHLLSGTHSISVALFGLVKRGDNVLCVSGMPYDTIRPVIYGDNIGSLKDLGVNFECCDLDENGKFDFTKIKKGLEKPVNLIYIQRSRGYELRDAFSCDEIGEVCSFIRKNGFNGCIFVDNCYGEF